MENICLKQNNKIIDIQLLACGSCENDLGIVFKNHNKEKRNFPAMVGLIKHSKYGYFLYDTGYSDWLKKCGWKYALYQLLNKATIRDEDIIISKLEAQGIKAEDIKYIILSHAHPDHIGALCCFHDYGLLSTREVFQSMKGRRIRDLIFENLLPRERIRKNVVKETKDTSHFLYEYFEHVYDICHDGSIIGVSLPGHAKGQLGLFFPEYQLLLAADACWGSDLMECVSSMNFIPRLIQNDYKDYQKTVDSLIRLQKDHPEIEIVFSHQVGGFPTYSGNEP